MLDAFRLHFLLPRSYGRLLQHQGTEHVPGQQRGSLHHTERRECLVKSERYAS